MLKFTPNAGHTHRDAARQTVRVRGQRAGEAFGAGSQGSRGRAGVRKGREDGWMDRKGKWVLTGCIQLQCAPNETRDQKIFLSVSHTNVEAHE